MQYSSFTTIGSFLQPQLLAATKFIAHLVNQQVAHEIVALELLTVLLERPTDDSVEVWVSMTFVVWVNMNICNIQVECLIIC